MCNALHNNWGSQSSYLINLGSKIGRNNVFLKAFQQRNRKKTKDRTCIDCLTKCWLNRLFTKNLPRNYQSLPSYSSVSTSKQHGYAQHEYILISNRKKNRNKPRVFEDMEDILVQRKFVYIIVRILLNKFFIN